MKAAGGLYQTNRMSFIYMKFAAESDENESQCLINRDLVTVLAESQKKFTTGNRQCGSTQPIRLIKIPGPGA
jgi:hypothetical protein